jgi:Domain of unknown function (DUF3943)
MVMKVWAFICKLILAPVITIAQLNPYTVVQDSLISFSVDKISLRENPLWIQLQPSQPNKQIDNKRDSALSTQTFGRMAWRAAKLILVGEVAIMGIFALMPESFSNWNKRFYNDATTHWKNAFTKPPRWDNDPLLVNYVQHPLAGAIYYNGVRAQGAKPFHSFLFSLAESTFFEYFIESVAERPSTQDLFTTPVAGAMIGELQNQATLLMKRNGFNFVERIAVLIINPMYVIFNGYKIKNHYH